MRAWHGVVWLAAIGLTGCVLGPNFQRPRARLPDNWPVAAIDTMSQLDEERVASRWWDSFGDAQLSSLIERAEQANLDLRRASIQVEQARAARRTVAAAAKPQLAAGLQASRNQASHAGLLDPSGLNGTHPYQVWDLGLDSGWELDLWGRVRREVEVADANIQVRRELLHGVRLSVAAQTAQAYFELRGVQRQQAIARDNLALAERSLELLRWQLRAGVSTGLELAQASARVADLQAALPPLVQQAKSLSNALSYLLGQPPGSLERAWVVRDEPPRLPSRVPVGLPSELAERRPDIRQAEAVLHAATANIGIAQADFYPRVGLALGVGSQALESGQLGDWRSHRFGLGSNFSLPLFQGGRLRGQLALSEARQRAAALDFQQTVLRAWHEIDDALGDYAQAQRRLAALHDSDQQNQLALAQVRRQYLAGAVDYLHVLAVQRDLASAEQARADGDTAAALALVRLYRALGGGWESGGEAASPSAQASSR